MTEQTAVPTVEEKQEFKAAKYVTVFFNEKERMFAHAGADTWPTPEELEIARRDVEEKLGKEGFVFFMVQEQSVSQKVAEAEELEYNEDSGVKKLTETLVKDRNLRNEFLSDTLFALVAGVVSFTFKGGPIETRFAVYLCEYLSKNTAFTDAEHAKYLRLEAAAYDNAARLKQEKENDARGDSKVS